MNEELDHLLKENLPLDYEVQLLTHLFSHWTISPTNCSVRDLSYELMTHTISVADPGSSVF